MNITQREMFINYWNDFFPNTQLPIIFYYSNDEAIPNKYEHPVSKHCVVADIVSVRNGRSIYYDAENIKCSGAKRYFGFSDHIRQDFNYFLSCGIEGQVEGERYKKHPELVEKTMAFMPPFEAPGKYLVFKRWDKLEDNDSIIGILFIAHADVISGLFTLANYDEDEPNAVMAPFSSGCASIVYHTYKESLNDFPKSILGMFDVSARPYVSSEELSFSIPVNKMERIISNIESSFLITDSWEKIQKRIRKYH